MSSLLNFLHGVISEDSGRKTRDFILKSRCFVWIICRDNEI